MTYTYIRNLIAICTYTYILCSCSFDYRSPIYSHGYHSSHQHYISCDRGLLQGRFTDEPTACYRYRYIY